MPDQSATPAPVANGPSAAPDLMQDPLGAASLQHESHWRVQVARVLNFLAAIGSLLLIVSISLEAFAGQAFITDSVYARIQLWVCLYFLVDVTLLIVLGPRKKGFVIGHFLLILLSIPYLSLINYFSLTFSPEMQYVLKFLPVLRGGVALIVLVKMLVSNKITGLFVAYLICFFSIFYFQTLIFYVFEKGLNPLVTNYYDALWWASLTVTTLGSNIVPVTVIGKVSTVFLAVIGLTVFPIFTVYITSLVQRMNQR